MVKKLQKRFILIAMGSVLVVLIGILGIINLLYYVQINQNADRLLNFLITHNGRFPEEDFTYGSDNKLFPIETAYQTRYFTVFINDKTKETSINMGHVAAIQPSEAYNYAVEVMNQGRNSGTFGNYKYMIRRSGSTTEIVFLDWESDLRGFRRLLLISSLILLIGLFIIFILITVLSRTIISPILNNIEKQRTFIADASHEIKTPLSIISADADVIEIIHGEDEWTESIKDQVIRLNELVKNLLTLSKMEGVTPKETISKFDVAGLIKEKADTFKPVAVNDNIHFITSIPDEVNFSGNKEAIDQLVSVLLNNAFKYTQENGTISLNVAKRGKSIIVTCNNTTDSVPSGNLNRLFDRFYRADNSRSRKTGSYGIGLSIAKAVAKQHKGNISAEKINDHTISFTAELNPI